MSQFCHSFLSSRSDNAVVPTGGDTDDLTAKVSHFLRWILGGRGGTEASHWQGSHETSLGSRAKAPAGPGSAPRAWRHSCAGGSPRLPSSPPPSLSSLLSQSPPESPWKPSCWLDAFASRLGRLMVLVKPLRRDARVLTGVIIMSYDRGWRSAFHKG